MPVATQSILVVGRCARGATTGFGGASQPALAAWTNVPPCAANSAVSVHHLDPRSVTAPVTSLRFLVGETGQAAQMPPVRAGQIAIVAPGQLFADRAGQRRFQ